MSRRFPSPPPPTWTARSAPPARRSTRARGRAPGRASAAGCCARSLTSCASTATSSCGIYAVSAEFVADIFEHHAGWADKLAGETLPPFQGGDHMVFTLREPVGVVGAVIPWNAPLPLFAQKVAPALAAGCTLVVKPSEYATFAVLRLARLIAEES